MPTFAEIKSVAEFLSYLATPLLAFFAYKMLGQLKIGSDQVKAATEQIITTKKASEIQSKRESLKIAAEQVNFFAEKIIPDIEKFLRLKENRKYPILSKAIVTENWPTIECKTDDLGGLIKEVETNDGLVIKTLNRVEGFAMFFTCGVADADAAYRPICRAFCDYVKIFLPFIIIANEKFNHYSNILSLYTAWCMRNSVEKAEKEISKQKQHLSKIKVPEMNPLGTKQNC